MMYPPALMLKTVNPFTELMRFKALSDEDLEMANERFRRRGEPYKIVRVSEEELAA